MARETEITIYCRIGNFEGLKEASHIEDHHQADSEYFNGDRCRCRMTRTAEGVSYVFTQKTEVPPENAQVAIGRVNDEDNAVVDEKFFKNFLKHSKKVVKKTRCCFPVKSVTIKFDESREPLVLNCDCQYEIDAFLKKDGTWSEWVKIDFELDPLIAYMKQHHPDISLDVLKKMTLQLSTLPFKPLQFIMGHTEDPNEKQKLSDIWENEFIFWKYENAQHR